MEQDGENSLEDLEKLQQSLCDDGLVLEAATHPISGVKVSTLVVASDGSLWFAPRFLIGSFVPLFSASDKAVCGRLTGHPAPHRRCTCGFYAVSKASQLGVLGSPTPFTVVSEVSLGGTIIEHELGMRCQLQKVLSTSLPRVCARCRQAEVSHLRATRAGISINPLLPVCARCSAHRSLTLSSRVFTLDEASSSLGVPLDQNPSFVLAQAPRYRPLRKTALVLASCAVLVACSAVAPVATGIAVVSFLAYRLARLTSLPR